VRATGSGGGRPPDRNGGRKDPTPSRSGCEVEGRRSTVRRSVDEPGRRSEWGGPPRGGRRTQKARLESSVPPSTETWRPRGRADLINFPSVPARKLAGAQGTTIAGRGFRGTAGSSARRIGRERAGRKESPPWGSAEEARGSLGARSGRPAGVEGRGKAASGPHTTVEVDCGCRGGGAGQGGRRGRRFPPGVRSVVDDGGRCSLEELRQRDDEIWGTRSSVPGYVERGPIASKAPGSRFGGSFTGAAGDGACDGSRPGID